MPIASEKTPPPNHLPEVERENKTNPNRDPMPLPPIDIMASRVAIELKHPSPLIGCRFDPSGRYLFTTAQDNSIQRFDLFTRKKTALLGHSSWSRGLGFVGTSATIMPITQRATYPIPLNQGGIFNALSSIAAAASSQVPNSPFTLISGDYLGELRWWDGTADVPIATRTVKAHEGWLRALDVSPDRKLLATCGNDHLVKLWSASDGKPIRTLEGHASHVYNVAFHPGGKTLVSADLKGFVKEWEVETGKPLRELDAKVFHKYDSGFAADIGGIRGMAFRPDGQFLAGTGITNVSNAFAGVGNPLVIQFDMKDGKAKQLKPKEAFQGTGWGVGYLPNGYLIAAGGAGQGRIWFWKPDDPASAHMLNVPANIRDLALHPDGTAFAVSCFNGSAYVYTMLPGPAVAKKDAIAVPKK